MSTLPPLDVAACPKGCGTWVSMFAASEVLTETDRRPDPITRWWRMREPCPECGDKMVLCGDDPVLLQGCEIHGYFIDADTIAKTGLARGVDHAALETKRDDPDRVDAERERLWQLEQAHEEQRRADAIKRANADAEHAKLVAANRHRARIDQVHDWMVAGDHRALAAYILALEDRIAALEAKLWGDAAPPG
jgi:hypothetical protein